MCISLGAFGFGYRRIRDAIGGNEDYVSSRSVSHHGIIRAMPAPRTYEPQKKCTCSLSHNIICRNIAVLPTHGTDEGQDRIAPLARRDENVRPSSPLRERLGRRLHDLGSRRARRRRFIQSLGGWLLDLLGRGLLHGSLRRTSSGLLRRHPVRCSSHGLQQGVVGAKFVLHSCSFIGVAVPRAPFQGAMGWKKQRLKRESGERSRTDVRLLL